MCKPSTSGTGAAEPCGRGGSSSAWCRPNGMCSRSCATSNSLRYALAWWHCQPSTAGQACTRIWGVRKASSSRRTRSICILTAMQSSRRLSMQMASCGSSPRGRLCNFPPRHAGAWPGRVSSRPWWNGHWTYQPRFVSAVALQVRSRRSNRLRPTSRRVAFQLGRGRNEFLRTL